MNIKADLASLEPKTGFTRREFVVTMLAVGFAAAVRPIAAQTVLHTDDQGLVTGEVKVPVKDGQIPAYRAMPAKGTNFPVVLVVQEIFGVHEYIRMAPHGFHADYRPSSRKDPAEDGWKKLQEWFKKHGVV